MHPKSSSIFVVLFTIINLNSNCQVKDSCIFPCLLTKGLVLSWCFRGILCRPSGEVLECNSLEDGFTMLSIAPSHIYCSIVDQRDTVSQVMCLLPICLSSQLMARLLCSISYCERFHLRSPKLKRSWPTRNVRHIETTGSQLAEIC